MLISYKALKTSYNFGKCIFKDTMPFNKYTKSITIPFLNISKKVGLYKLDSRNCFIEQLAKLTDKSGKPRFNIRDIKHAVLKHTNSGKKPLISSTEEEFQELYREAIYFAENEPNATLKEIAMFANLRNGNWASYNALPQARKAVFREILHYIDDPASVKMINGNAERLKVMRTPTQENNMDMIPGIYEILKNSSDETINLYRQLLKMKRPKGAFPTLKGFDYLFNGEEIYKISQIPNLDTKNFIKLAKTSGLNGLSLNEVVNVEGINLRKLNQTINQIKKQHNGDVVLSIEREPYDKNKFIMYQWSKDNDKELLLNTFDNEMNLLSTEKVIPLKGSKRVKIIGKDYEIVQEARTGIFDDVKEPLKTTKYCYTVSETREIKDVNGNLIRTERMTPSDVENMHNWETIMPDGTIKPIVKVKKNNGVLTITKDMESLDGVITKSKFKQLPNGSYAMKINITDGNSALSKRFVSHRIISDVQAISTINGKKFKIIYSKNKIEVSEVNGRTGFTIDLDKLIDPNSTPKQAEKIRNILKQCSADELEIVSKKVNKITLVDYKNGSAGVFDGHIKTDDDIFTFKHELGHIDDLTGKKYVASNDFYKGNADGKYSGNSEFIKINDTEREMFMEVFPTVQRRHLDYFIDQMRRASSQQETAAELLATKGAVNIEPSLVSRTEYIERYMPRTRSHILNYV